MHLLIPLLLSGCGPRVPEAWPVVDAPTPPPASAPAVSLADLRDPVELVLPASTRPGGAAAPADFEPPGAWKKGASGDSWQVWSIPLPVDFHLFLQRQAGARTFGFYAPQGLDVAWKGEDLRFERNAKGSRTWGYSTDRLMVALPPEAGPPTGIKVRWPKATAAERALHLDTSDREPVDFALRGVAQGTTSHTGALLPAPATIAWEVDVPDGAVLAAKAWLLPPAIHTSETSDGATLRVEIDVGGATRVLATEAIGAAPLRLRVPLGVSGPARVRLVVDPGATVDHDLVFVEDPTIYVPTAHPRRVVMAFVDTVRHDHLGMYGYARPTTPRLDAWAKGATRFDDAHTVAPWTLPSALSVLSGRQPEDWAAGPSLAERLSAAGFRTRGIVANAYLSQVFGVDRGFDHYTYAILQPAAATVDQALAEIAAWPDRDLFLLVQFMEAHLPYDEPKAYRGLFEGDKPDNLKAIARTELVRWKGDEPDFAPIRDHVLGRYDQNLRVLDDEVARLFEALGPSATTVLFADHGEEFWDHGGFEHGHSFHEELLKVPLVVRSPALKGAPSDLPVSLLDVAPTLLDLLGLPPGEGLAGSALRPAVHGDADARATLLARAQGYGRPLYGEDGWSVYVGGQKWVARDGLETVHALKDDPTERDDLAGTVDRAPFPVALQGALGRDVVPVWRLRLRLDRLPGDVEVRLQHPGGLAGAWSAYDPKGWTEGVTPQVADGAVVIRRGAGQRAPDEVFVRPVRDAADLAGLVVTLTAQGEVREIPGLAAPAADAKGRLAVVHDPQGVVVGHLTWAAVPGGVAVKGYDEEVDGALKALGYVE